MTTNTPRTTDRSADEPRKERQHDPDCIAHPSHLDALTACITADEEAGLLGIRWDEPEATCLYCGAEITQARASEWSEITRLVREHHRENFACGYAATQGAMA